MATISEALAIAIRHHQAGQIEEARGIYLQILMVEPGQAQATHYLGVIAFQVGNLETAARLIARAIVLDQSESEFFYNLGCIQREFREHTKAVNCFRLAVELRPDYPDALNNLGNMLKDRGDLESGLACYQRIMALKPRDAVARSNYLMGLQYRPGVTPELLLQAHSEYDECLAGPMGRRDRPLRRKLSGQDRLRLGFVSPDFGRHAVGYLMEPFFRSLRTHPVDLIGYSDRRESDEMTARLQASATEWRNVSGWSDDRLAARISGDRIDILFDLAGHTAFNRLLVFARRAAPVQVSWAGYVGTTGLRTMDYLLADRWLIPPASKQFYREQVLYMPGCYVCFSPVEEAPEVAALPALRNGYPTFGCFNNPSKINRQVVEVWAQILKRIPQAQLVLKYLGMSDASNVSRISKLFAAQGIDPGRLQFLDFIPSRRDALATYGQIDVALDPFPYSGALTTCEALWMGVPVVTWPGETFAARQSCSLIAAAGLASTIARDLENYVELAVQLLEDSARLSGYRKDARRQMANSPLCDTPGFAQDFFELISRVWQHREV